jgi:hypothetical protein
MVNENTTMNSPFQPVHYSATTIEVTKFKLFTASTFHHSSYSNSIICDQFIQYHIQPLLDIGAIYNVNIGYDGRNYDYDKWDGIVYPVNHSPVVIEIKERYNTSQNDFPFTNMGEEDKRLALLTKAQELHGQAYIVFICNDGHSWLYNLNQLKDSQLKKKWKEVPAKSEDFSDYENKNLIYWKNINGIDKPYIKKLMVLYPKDKAIKFEMFNYRPIKEVLTNRKNKFKP